MNIAELFKEVKMSLKEEELEVVSRENEREWYSILIEDFNTYDKLEEVLTKKGLDIHNVKFVRECMYKIWYVDRGFYLDLQGGMVLLDDVGKNIDLNAHIEKISKLAEEGSWKLFYGYLPDELRLDYFNNHYTEMDLENQKKIFEYVYTKADYPMSVLDKNVMFNVLAKGEYKKQLEAYADENGNITIFRGQTSESTPINDAISYSLDYNVAASFSARFSDTNSVVWKASVNIEDIYLYTNVRNEQEVIVKYEDLKDVKDMKVYNLIDILSCTKEYQDSMVYNETYNTSTSYIHGFKHSQRMIMLLCLLNKKRKRKLSKKDFNILLGACVAHDLGRVNDGGDIQHGLRSEEMIEGDMVESLGLNTEDEDILRFIVAHHCSNDEYCLDKLQKTRYMNAKQKERCKRLLFLFKDIDNLDRVRIRDLDVRYLRSNEALLAVPAAHLCLSFIK